MRNWWLRLSREMLGFLHCYRVVKQPHWGAWRLWRKACLLILTECGLLVPPTRDRTACSLQLKHGVLTSGPPGSPKKGFIEFCFAFFSLHLQRLNITEMLEVVILKVTNAEHTDLEKKGNKSLQKEEICT